MSKMVSASMTRAIDMDTQSKPFIYRKAIKRTYRIRVPMFTIAFHYAQKQSKPEQTSEWGMLCRSAARRSRCATSLGAHLCQWARILTAITN